MIQSTNQRRRTAGIAIFFAAALLASGRFARGQEAAPPAATTPPLPAAEAGLAERYDRLEVLAGRLAELSQTTQPRRAALLRELVAKSREKDVPGQFDAVIDDLEKRSYSSALTSQAALHQDLSQLLELLLQEDRDRDLDAQRKRVRRYLQDLNRLIRLQRGVQARTDGGDDQRELSGDQQRVADETGKLGKEIEDAEGIAEQRAKREREAAEQRAKQAPHSKDAKSNDSDSKKPSSTPSKPGKPSDQSKPGESKPNDSKPGESKPGESSPSQSKPGASKPSQSPPSGSPPSPSGESPPEGDSPPPQQSPEEKATDSLQKAQQRMGEAQKRLEEAKRDGAKDEQQKALEELEQAKAQLERILRQLREEELERMLVMLEARFRKMLDMQVEVYDETKRLDASTEKAPAHELEIAGGRLSRREELIVREADRALVLLREDGTSVAFPEAIEQAREDMKSIVRRLADVKFEMLTQGLEEDVIASLEETLAALQQAIKNLREQRAKQQQGSGEPGEQPLVDQLAELRMIRSLQMRVNRRTQRYGAMIEGEQAKDPELIQALELLSVWQQKIFRATHELDVRSSEQ